MSRTDVTVAATVHHATGPNQVWSWDITWLPTTVRGIYLHLYLVMDVWSRRIVGWRIADGDSAQIAAELITQTCREDNLDPRGLVLQAESRKSHAAPFPRARPPELLASFHKRAENDFIFVSGCDSDAARSVPAELASMRFR